MAPSRDDDPPRVGTALVRPPSPRLAEGIVTGHADMPEFVLTPDEIGAVISYLESLEN